MKDPAFAGAGAPEKPAEELPALALLLLFGLALVLRLYDLGAESFWGDEINMIRFSRGERSLELSFGNALLYLPILRLFGSFAGQALSAEVAYRLPAALFGAATVPLVALLALRWDGRRVVALLAALFVALSPAHLALSQEAHAYAAFVFWVVAALLCAERAGRRGDLPSWLGLAACASIAPHFHLFLFVLLPPLLTSLLLARPELWRRPRRAELQAAAAAALLYLVMVANLLWRWVLPLTARLLTKIRGAEDSGVEYFDTNPYLFTIDRELFAKAFRELMMWRSPFVVLIWAAAALLLVGLVALYRRRPASVVLLISFVVLALPPITYFSWASRIDFGTRRLIFFLPLLGLAFGAACLALGELVARLARRKERAQAAGLACGLVAALVYAGSATTGYYFGETKWDLRSTARLIEEKAEPGDLVLVFTADRLSLYHSPQPEQPYELHELWWYRNHLDLENLPDRMLVFWPATFLVGRFGELGQALEKAGAVNLPLGTGYQLSLLDRRASPEQRRAEARKMLEALIAIKGERPYLRARLAELYLEEGREAEALAEQQQADRRSLRGRFPTRYFFFGQ